ncbi:MAG: hypothetical protein FJ279_19710 [Planctomycetes bacterium]|nr:hypothetical protein [Planctomycetota bacterium]
MTYRRMLLSLLLALVARPGLADSLRFHLPFDGDCRPAVSPVQRDAVVRGRLEFGEGVRGKALLIGGKSGAQVTFAGTEYVNTASFPTNSGRQRIERPWSAERRSDVV